MPIARTPTERFSHAHPMPIHLGLERALALANLPGIRRLQARRHVTREHLTHFGVGSQSDARQTGRNISSRVSLFKQLMGEKALVLSAITHQLVQSHVDAPDLHDDIPLIPLHSKNASLNTALLPRRGRNSDTRILLPSSMTRCVSP
eukprot:scaffold26647_cov115-Isochrysis_galbana.AAC.1